MSYSEQDGQVILTMSQEDYETFYQDADRAVRSRKHTQDWYASHYGKLEDWARKRLPEPWRNEFFHCVANGTWGHDDLGEPYMSQVGRIVPSGYFKMDSATEQLLRDQTTRAENAELEIDRLNSGNPNYTPYQIVSDKITQPWVRREDLHSRCCDAPVMVGDDDVCSKCGRPCSHTPYQVEEKKI